MPIHLAPNLVYRSQRRLLPPPPSPQADRLESRWHGRPGQLLPGASPSSAFADRDARYAEAMGAPPHLAPPSLTRIRASAATHALQSGQLGAK